MAVSSPKHSLMKDIDISQRLNGHSESDKGKVFLGARRVYCGGLMLPRRERQSFLDPITKI